MGTHQSVDDDDGMDILQDCNDDGDGRTDIPHVPFHSQGSLHTSLVPRKIVFPSISPPLIISELVYVSMT